ncbi:RnaseH-domain-containing protein [Calocera cornea HHB12733]|uniref:ribonuclease H n=1 Tax=Calocera cornea HHB12733 TaxID=1353952 RepID=A0A165FZA6_9BASI|nr:RnaseH-domain-containing protein [Calocera cornea HHB12733]
MSTIRIFVPTLHTPDLQVPAYTRPPLGAPQPPVIIYTDGSSKNNGAENARVGAGAWCETNPEYNVCARLPGIEQTNQRGELAAILLALHKIPPTSPVVIRTDSLTSMNGLTTQASRWEDGGWIDTKNEDICVPILNILRSRTATTTFEWVKGHAGIRGNEEADRLAELGALRETPDALPLARHPATTTLGARLASLTFNQIYHHIIKWKVGKKTLPRQTVKDHLTLAQHAIAGRTPHGLYKPSTTSIWAGIWQPPFHSRCHDFLWKVTQTALKCGPYFSHFAPTKSLCLQCDQLETAAHVIFDCPKPHVHQLWQETEALWDRLWPGIPWVPPNIHILRGLGAYTVRRTNGSTHSHPTHMYKVLVSTTAYQLWLHRNEKTFQNRTAPQIELTRKWKHRLREQLQIEHTKIGMYPPTKQGTARRLFQRRWCTNDVMATLDGTKLYPHTW